MSNKLIVAADDLETLRHIQPLLLEQGYDLIVAIRGPESPTIGVSNHTSLVGKFANDEEREKLEQRLVTAEHIQALARSLPGARCDIVSLLRGVLGLTELAQQIVEEGSEMQDYLAGIEQAALH